MARIAEDLILDTIINNETKLSVEVDLDSIFGYSMQANISGTSLSGTISLEHSNDGKNWVEVPLSARAITGTGAIEMYNEVDTFYAYVRASIENTTSNDMKVQVFYKGKGV